MAEKVYRVVRRGRDPLSTEWTLRNGGRYNPPGEFPALYASLEKSTAAAEKARSERNRGIGPEQYSSGEWWAYEIAFDLQSVLDLTDGAVVSNLSLDENALLSEDRTTTHQIAREARAAGFQALLVPSVAAHGEKNLVVFMDRLHAQPRVLTSEPVSLA